MTGALRLVPDDAEVMNSRGNAYIDLENVDRAIAEFDGAIALRPDFSDAFNNRATPIPPRAGSTRRLPIMARPSASTPKTPAPTATAA